jgi:Zn-dependent protease with chaperone function
MAVTRDTSLTELWTPEERESFFVAIARHRRAAWQVGAISILCIALLALILAVLTAPLFYAVIGLALDLINLVTPMPDLLGSVMEALGELSDSPDPIPSHRWVSITLTAALPGLVVFAVFAHMLRRLVREAETGSLAHLAQRTPDASKLPEHRLANVVAEMALAANVPAPRILIAAHEVPDAAVFGASEDTATIVVTSGFLDRLDRSSMPAAAGHLVCPPRATCRKGCASRSRSACSDSSRISATASSIRRSGVGCGP